MTGKYIYLLAFISLLGSGALGQKGENPFELTPRLPASERIQPDAEEIAAESPPGNPFEMVAPPEGSPEIPQTTEMQGEEAEEEPFAYRRFKFGLILFLLLLLAFLVTLLRSSVRKTYRAFLNENLMNQLYRNQAARGNLPFLLLYGMFFINAAAFLFFLMYHSGYLSTPPYWKAYLFILVGLVSVFLFKHLLLFILGSIFPLRSEMSLYSFTIIVFSIILGFALLPLNLLAAYAPSQLIWPALYTGIGIAGATYLYRSVRGLIIGYNYLFFHKFHFLLYICTVEIAPALVLLKLIMNNL
ncbi:MAG: DUF4271 domain-containing protein [Saprospiraceae bacterium]|nr:DUF4271 domain-containing protein [Saprospiraceae bacterium]